MSNINNTPAERKLKFAWAKFYEASNTHHNDNYRLYLQQQNIHNQMVAENIPQHITNELFELNTALKKSIECPICLDVIDGINLQLVISKCGHKYCNNCLTTLKNSNANCAICRKKL